MSRHAPAPSFLCDGRVWRIARPAANYYNGTDSMANAVRSRPSRRAWPCGRRGPEEQRGHAKKAADRRPNLPRSHVTSTCAARASAPEGSGPRRRAADGGAAAGAALMNGVKGVARLYAGRLAGPIAGPIPKTEPAASAF